MSSYADTLWHHLKRGMPVEEAQVIARQTPKSLGEIWEEKRREETEAAQRKIESKRAEAMKRIKAQVEDRRALCRRFSRGAGDVVVTDLAVPTRTRACLAWHGCETVEDVLALGERALLATPNYGKTSHARLTAALERAGFKWIVDVPRVRRRRRDARRRRTRKFGPGIRRLP